jgi:mannose-1-phosphate guanylyltransferase
MVALLSKVEEQYDVKITFSVETEPLGTGNSACFSSPRRPRLTRHNSTAGPLALAKEILGKDDAPFFVLNSDVTCT